MLTILILAGPVLSAEPRLWYVFTFEGSGNRLRLLFGPFGPSDNPLQHARAADSMLGIATPIGRLAPISGMRMLDIPLPPDTQREPARPSTRWWGILHVEGTRDRPGGWLYVFIGPFGSGAECTSAVGKMLYFSLPVGRLMFSVCERLAFDY